MKPVKVQGTVTKVEWVNPHSYITIEAKGDGENGVTWTIEGLPVGVLRRSGVGRDFVRVGDEITVSGYASRDGSKRMSGRQIINRDSQKAFFGPLPN